MNQAYTLGNLATLDQRRKKISPRLHVAPHQAFEFVAKPSDGIHAVYLVALGDDVTLTVAWDGSKDVSEGAVVNVREVV